MDANHHRPQVLRAPEGPAASALLLIAPAAACALIGLLFLTNIPWITIPLLVAAGMLLFAALRRAERPRVVAAADRGQCEMCRSDLRGLAGDRCPECGAARPAAGAPRLIPGLSPFWRWAAALLLVLGVAWGGFMIAWTYSAPRLERDTRVRVWSMDAALTPVAAPGVTVEVVRSRPEGRGEAASTLIRVRPGPVTGPDDPNPAPVAATLSGTARRALIGRVGDTPTPVVPDAAALQRLIAAARPDAAISADAARELIEVAFHADPTAPGAPTIESLTHWTVGWARTRATTLGCNIRWLAARGTLWGVHAALLIAAIFGLIRLRALGRVARIRVLETARARLAA